jgi:hypothetical protein
MEGVVPVVGQVGGLGDSLFSAQVIDKKVNKNKYVQLSKKRHK